MPLAKINQHHLYYEQHGSGKDLVLIGGFTSDHTVWTEMIESLSKFYRVLIFDNPCAGRSYIPNGNYSLASMSSDIVTLLDYLNIEHANFIGHSMGAALLMQLCIEYSQKVNKAILCGGPASAPITAKLQVQGLRYAIDHQFSDEYIALSVMPWIHGRRFLNDKKRVDKLNARYINNQYPQTVEGFRTQANVVLEFDISSRLKEIETECLIVASDEDLLIPLHCTQYLKNHIRNSELKIIGEGVGHMVHIEEPEQLIKLSLNFFQDIPLKINL
ncbi:MAG: hypothetical protein A3E85_04620 [Gammaproteobacteria bacterium RIFCSPHIGHO2_12_FULL_45_12]|nr:MAG: hypothetical protein A3E85_04620 [Gammaproteobacteria bacterium RIFCSPHIGHO2_12_FULL_45_12]